MDDKEVSVEELVSVGENLIIIKGSSSIKIRTYRKKTVTETENEEDTESEEAPNNDDVINLLDTAGKKLSSFKGNPQRLISDYSFLVGRIVTKNISDTKSNVLVPKGSIINDDIVNLARHSGKLVELTVNSIR